MNTKEKSLKFERPLLVLNPVAGTSDPEEVRKTFQQVQEQFGWQPVVHETTEDEDLAEVVKKGIKDGCDVILAGGGDGTVAKVASTLMGSDIPLGIIPLGTGNQLAKQLGLPTNFAQAFELIGEQPEIICLDAMKIKERYFLLNASAGFSSEMIQDTTRKEKRRLGFFAYILNGFHMVFGIQPHRFMLDIDGKSHALRASEIFISSSFFLRNQDFLKDIHMQGDDGEVEVFVVKARTLWDYGRLFFSLIKRNAWRLKKVDIIPAKQWIEIRSRNPVTFQADGEILGTTPVRIEIIPQAIQILIPRDEEDE